MSLEIIEDPSRMLSVAVGTKSTVTTTTTDETEKMSVIFFIFHSLANLGGFYTFCIIIVGIFLRPVLDKIFMHEIINDYNEGHRGHLGKYQNFIVIGEMKAIEDFRMDKMMEMERFGLLGSTDKGSYAQDNSFQEDEQLYPEMQYDGGSGGDLKKSN
jgi:hypothetical protein